jgi:hypothetical protein
VRIDNTDVTNNLALVTDINNGSAGQGVQAGFRSTVRFRNGSAVSGNAGFGLQCLGNEASFSGDTSGIASISSSYTGF